MAIFLPYDGFVRQSRSQLLPWLRKEGATMIEPGGLTSTLMWRSALVAALIDAPLLLLLARFIPGELFHKLKWYLVGAAGLVYALLWGVVGSVIFWDTVYSAIFPAWFRWLLPLIYGLLFGALALGFWRLSLLAARWQGLWFCLLGGLVSLAGHSIGISRGLMRVPLLAETSPAAALVFGVFEFTFYFCIIVTLAVLARWLGWRLRQMVSHRLSSWLSAKGGSGIGLNTKGTKGRQGNQE
jgi:hypothetical protein